MVFEDLDNENLKSKRHLIPLVTSLMLHAVLAFILWSLVFGIESAKSIRLTASLSTPSSTVSLKVRETVQPVSPVTVDGDQPAKSSDSTIEEMLVEILADRVIEDPEQTENADDADQDLKSKPVADFFGAEAVGNRFVFIIDNSYSMDARNMERYQRAKDELIRSISNLKDFQSYCIFLFSWHTRSMAYTRTPVWIKAENQHIKKLEYWLNDTQLDSGTDPRLALSLANAMNPDAIFLLSDGQFNHPTTPLPDTGWLLPDGTRSHMNVLDGINKLMSSIPIHTISFENPFTRVSMEQIAEASGGSYRYIKTQSITPVDSKRFLKEVQRIEQLKIKAPEIRSELQRRMSIARGLIADGEFAFAEYIARPIRDADAADINNPVLRQILLDILDDELGETRLENLQLSSEVEQWIRQHKSE